MRRLETIEDYKDALEHATMAADYAAENALASFLKTEIEFDACSPEDDAAPFGLDPSKTFARIAYWEDRGDDSVGLQGSAGWALTPDQSGTVLADVMLRKAALSDELAGIARWLRSSCEANPSALNVAFNKFALIQTVERIEKLASDSLGGETDGR